jgi:CRISPR-associated endonuclease Cas1
MHLDPSTSSLDPPADGLVFLCGHAASLRVHRGHLVARSGSGSRAVEARFARGSRQRVRRVVLYGKGGYVTVEALAWLHGVGASLVCLDTSGRILASSGLPGPDQPALRRAQALATESDSALVVARYLLGEKLGGQSGVAKSIPAPEARSVIDLSLTRLEEAATLRESLAAEANAAIAYWRAWESVSVSFARADVEHLPSHWLTAGERHSPLSSGPRLAVTPVGAIFNYLYALAEFECRIALIAIGLDPGIGWFHRDAPYRDSAALDLMEAVRPDIDAYVFDLARTRTFARKEFFELPNGQVRIARSLARLLAESSLSRWQRAIAGVAEELARLVASSAKSHVHTRTRLTQADRKRGRKRAGSNGRQVPNACRLCGLILERSDRKVCDDCIPVMKAEKAAKLASAGRVALAKARSQVDDPSQTEEARRKRSEKSRQTSLAIRAWEREHGPTDPDIYRRDILPAIQAMTVPALVRVTGLSRYYCWEVREGRKMLHARFWERLSESDIDH